MKQIIAIYPGRFQPMGQHHFKSFQHLQKAFGAKNVFIATSDKTDMTSTNGIPKSPFNFDLKARIAKEYGVPASQIILTKNPYKAEEITSKFDPRDTAVVFAVGQKDMDEDPRFKIGFKKSGDPSYFQDYFKNRNDLQGFDVHGYLYVLPHVKLNTPGGEMSGTKLREFIASNRDPREFEKVFGWYNDAVVADMQNAMGIKETFSKDWWKQLFTEAAIIKLITEGGAAGHMAHPFDDSDLTFDELREMIQRALSGELNIEKDVTEKTDGQNLQVTYKNGKVMAARNKSQILNPIDADELQIKFAGRGDIENAFVFAMKDLEEALHSLPPNDLDKIFQNGRNFLNLEIIYPATKNVINYGPAAYLQFHGISEYDDSAKLVRSIPEYAGKLQKMIADVNASTQKNFKIIPPQVIKFNKPIDFDAQLNSFMKRVNDLQKQYQLNGNNTLGNWYDEWWKRKIDDTFPEIDENLRTQLINRWANGDKSFRLVKANVPNEGLLKTIADFDKTEVPKLAKAASRPFEELFLNLGAEVLSNAENFLSASPSDTVKDLRKDIAQTIRDIKNSDDIATLQKMKTQLDRVKAAGGFDKIVPAEGVVFVYKGNTYKLTGAFAPINQLLGITRYAR